MEDEVSTQGGSKGSFTKFKPKWYWNISKKETFFMGIAVGLLLASLVAYLLYDWRVGEAVLQKSIIYQHEVYDINKRL